MSEQHTLEQMLQEGMSAARDGQKARARALFQQVVEANPDDEKAWYWLASVVETDSERITALKKVLQINPNNARARELLDRMRRRYDEPDEDGNDLPRNELMAGVDRRLVLIGAGVLAVLALAIVIGVAVSASARNRTAQEQAAAVQAATNKAVVEATATMGAQQTEVAAIAATGEFTGPAVAGRPTLPPTWTPAVTEVGAGLNAEATPLPTAVGSGLFTGRLLGVSGQDMIGNGYVPVVEIPLDGSPIRTLYGERGGFPDMAPQGDRLIYTIYSVGTRDQGLQLAWLDGSRDPQLLAQLLGTRVLQKQNMASFSPDGSRLVFQAQELENLGTDDIYVVSLGALNPQGASAPATDALLRLTTGTVNSYAPAWGDSTRLVYVHDALANGGTVDLKLIDLSGQNDFLTTDGNTLIENYPDISPNGQQIAFSAYSPANPNDSDIYVMSLIGGQPLLVVDTPTQAISPRWSPDGRFLAYASDQDGDFEIYIVEVATFANYQVTVNTVHDMVNEWLP